MLNWDSSIVNSFEWFVHHVQVEMESVKANDIAKEVCLCSILVFAGMTFLKINVAFKNVLQMSSSA